MIFPTAVSYTHLGHPTVWLQRGWSYLECAYWSVSYTHLDVYKRQVKPKEETALDRRYQELLEQVRLLDTEAFQLKKESLVSQLQEAYTAKDSQRLEQEGKLLQAIQEMQDRTGVTSVDYLKYFYQSLSAVSYTHLARCFG